MPIYMVQSQHKTRAFRSIHLFSPLFERGLFHVYVTAQAQNVAPRIFAFLIEYGKPIINKTRKHSEVVEQFILLYIRHDCDFSGRTNTVDIMNSMLKRTSENKI